MTDEEIVAVLEGYRHEIASLKHRMDNVEKVADAVHTLALEMARQTEEIKHMNGSIRQLTDDVADLKAKPGRQWEMLIGALIGAVVSAAASMFFEGR